MRNGVKCVFLFVIPALLVAGKSPSVAEDHPSWIQFTGDASIAFDYFRSLPEGSWQGNMGVYGSLNFGMPMTFSNYCFGPQLGASYGIYDWYGRGSTLTGNASAVQQEIFLTAGLYEETLESLGVNAGIVCDWMFNRKLGVFGVNPTLGQVRAAIGCFFFCSQELGFWGTINTLDATKEADQVPVKFQAISQVNLFWSYYFKNSAKTSIWIGTPYRRGLMYSSGRAGNYIFGGSVEAPLASRLSVFSRASYMGPRNGSTSTMNKNYAANVCVGLTYAFGSRDSNARKPYLPLADNTNFIVDTSQNL